MTRDNKKRYADEYRIVGLRFSNGKKIIELCATDQISKSVAVYVAKEDVWDKVSNICNTLIHATDTESANGSKMVSFHIENVQFDKPEELQVDENPSEESSSEETLDK